PRGMPGPADPARPGRPGLREAALAVVLALTAYRAYSGVVRHDWPFVRGGDQFSHAIMAEQMLMHGSYGTYLIYPPGFPPLTAAGRPLPVLRADTAGAVPVARAPPAGAVRSRRLHARQRAVGLAVWHHRRGAERPRPRRRLRRVR